MGKFYENLDVLTQLVKKLEKKRMLAEFIIRLLSNMKENPKKSISDVITETKKEYD